MSPLSAKSISRIATVTLLAVACWGQPVAAQLKLEADEAVKISYLGDWLDGKVVDKGPRGQYLVEFVWANVSRREVFERLQIRKRYEFQGRDFGRNWESASGTFKVEAALMAVEGDDVRLIKPDMSEITVPLDRLSTRDASYVKKFQKQFDQAVTLGQIPASWPELPKLEAFADASFSGSQIFDAANKPLRPFGKTPDYLRKFQQNGVAFGLVRPRQELVSAIAVGGPDQLVLVNGREGNFFNNGVKFQSQLYWLSMKQNKVLATVAVANEDYLLDYDPRNRLLLTFNEKEFSAQDSDEPHHLTLWQLGIGEGSAEPRMRWDISSHYPEFGDMRLGCIISENVVLTQSSKNQYVGWNVSEKKVAYTLETRSFFGAPVRVTPDRKYLIAPEDGQISVFDTETGEFAMGAKVNARHVSGANVNSSGNRLAAVTEQDVIVWDLESENGEPSVYPAPLVASPFSSRIDWIDDDKVLVESFDSRILFSLKHGLPLWTYRTANPLFNDEPLVNYVINGILFYTEQDFFNSQAVAVGAVELPGPAVEEMTANLDVSSLMILKAGSPIGLELKNVDSASQVEGWLKQKIVDNQWQFDPDAEIVLHAEMGIGPTQTVHYGRFGSPRATTTVSYRPHFSRLKIMRGQQLIWQSGTSSGAPGVVRGSSEQIQTTIDSYQRPNVDYFRTAKIDAEIIDPKYSRGFGVSVLGRRGIEVVSTTPPGRPDDPVAAQEEFREEQEKAKKERQQTGRPALDDDAGETESGAATPPTGSGN